MMSIVKNNLIINKDIIVIANSNRIYRRKIIIIQV